MLPRVTRHASEPDGVGGLSALVSGLVPAILLPPPRRVSWGRDRLHLSSGAAVVIGPGVPEAVARLLIQRVHNHYQVDFVDDLGARTTTITLAIEAGAAPAQGYRLTIGADGVHIVGADVDGVCNGAHTLWQLMSQEGLTVPHGEVHDWPALAMRGVMLDISRDRTPTLDTLYELVELVSTWKINQLQLYTEHTFAYRNHPAATLARQPITGAELRDLDDYCAARNIELVPNQATFGHMWRWLRLPEYRHLAECPDGFDWMLGRTSQPFSLAPLHPGSLDLAADLVGEQQQFVRSRRVNVNCDETWDVGQGASAEASRQTGAAAVYADYLSALVDRVDADEVQFWGDVLGHSPQLVADLPERAVPLLWQYEASANWDERIGVLSGSNRRFVVCPGTSSWSSIGGRVANMRANVLEAALAAERHGAAGMLVADWGDGGHWQQYPVRLPGLLMAACQAWSPGVPVDLAAGLDATAFFDPLGLTGALLCELGEVVAPVVNGSLLWWSYAAKGALVDEPGRAAQALDLAERADHLATRAARLEPNVRHADRLRGEVELAALMLAEGGRRLAAMCGTGTFGALDELIERYTVAWNLRDRPDGLDDSTAKLRGEQPLHELLDPVSTERLLRRFVR